MPDEGAGDKGQDSDVVIATGRYPFYRRYHSDALRGMSKLTLEQRGAYDLVLDMTYENGGPIDDDDAHLARQANCSPRKWRAVKADHRASRFLLCRHHGVPALRRDWGNLMIEAESRAEVVTEPPKRWRKK